MFRDILRNLDGLHVMSSIGMLIFFLVFLALATQLLLRRRKDVQAQSLLPLSDGDLTDELQRRSQP